MALEDELINILRQYGHNVYLQRRRDVNETGPYREVDGGRYEAWVEKWTIYRWFGKSVDHKLMGDGFVGDYDAHFAFEPRAQIKAYDLIHEDTPNERTMRSAYRIERAVPYYLGTRLIYLRADCNRLSPIA